MLAAAITKPNHQLENLKFIELEQPKPEINQVLIKVRYASLNPVDYKLIAQQPPIWSYPYVPGLDLVGEVVEVGAKCRLVKVGDMVALHANLTFGGALAEYSVQNEHTLFLVPDGFDLAYAAAVPCAGLTAYQALIRKMNVKAGKTILIQGGSGGVGSFAIIIAKALGLKVITTCSGPNLAYVKGLGADIVIDYASTDIYRELKRILPTKLDYILETSNKINLQRDPELLAFNGHLASIVGILDFSIIQEFTTGLSFHEVALGGAYLSGDYAAQVDLALMGRELLNLLTTSKLRPQLNIYSFNQIQQAFKDLQNNLNPGKVVIQIS